MNFMERRLGDPGAFVSKESEVFFDSGVLCVFRVFSIPFVV